MLGYFSAFAAYTIWGLLVLYWRAVAFIPPLSLLAYRIISTCTFLWVMLGIIWIIQRRRQADQKSIFYNFKTNIMPSSLAALAIVTNWYLYIWAILNDVTIDASLGYFLTPFMNIVLGYFLLKERPGRRRTIAIGLSAIAIVILTISRGSLPIISLGIALSFGLYGFIKKKSQVNPLLSLALELTWLLVPALFIALQFGEPLLLRNFSRPELVLFLFLAPVTIIPLLLFTFAAQRIPLYVLGFFQYITPSILFILVVTLFQDQTTIVEIIVFVIIWIALVLFSSTLMQKNAFKQIRKN